MLQYYLRRSSSGLLVHTTVGKAGGVAGAHEAFRVRGLSGFENQAALSPDELGTAVVHLSRHVEPNT